MSERSCRPSPTLATAPGAPAAVRRWPRAMAAVAVLSLVAAACGSSGTKTAVPGQAAVTTTTVGVAPTTTVPAAGTYPMTIKSGSTSVVIPSKPRRIVSLSPTATEDLYAIGAGSQVVAVDSYSDYPKDAPRTKIDALNPSVEGVAAHRPDLVVVSGGPANFPRQMAQLKIPTVNEPAAANLAQAYQEMEVLGRLTGHMAQAKKVVAGIKSKITHLVGEIHRSSPPLTYYYELSPDYYSITSDTFVGQLFSMLGLKNIADARGAKAAGGYPQLSPESIIAAQPDLIFLADTICCAQTAAKVGHRAGWSTIPAVKDGAVVPLNDDIASRWGPRIVILLSDIVAAVKKLQAKK